MTGSTATVARYALIEARRSGLPWLAAACVLTALGVLRGVLLGVLDHPVDVFLGQR